MIENTSSVVTPLLAQLSVDLPGVELSGSSPMLKDLMLVLGILAVLTSVLFLVVRLFFSGGKRKSAHRRRQKPSGEAIRISETVATENGERRRRKYRKRKKEHRPRNPTRAETGGLPIPQKEMPATDASR